MRGRVTMDRGSVPAARREQTGWSGSMSLTQGTTSWCPGGVARQIGPGSQGRVRRTIDADSRPTPADTAPS